MIRQWSDSDRVGGLRRFAIAITLFTILGHTLLGFEQSILQPILALLTAYTMELGLELADARLNRRALRFKPTFAGVVDFLLSAHITALAVTMLLYCGDRLCPVIFGTAVAIGSKSIFRVAAGRGSRHVFNPSNFGISITLLCFPWVGIAPPYQFTEGVGHVGDWIVPAVIVCTGTFLNARYTRRLPLIAAWLIMFLLQAVVRSLVFQTPLAAALLPMSGVAFILYTFYMVTDPATTPAGTRGQLAFGAAVAATYGLLMVLHVVFGLFFALSIVCAARLAGLWLRRLAAEALPQRPLPAPAVGEP
jgi:Na+-translocating ferredoxin:NAD+ oxidoreductase RnfD subunit